MRSPFRLYRLVGSGRWQRRLSLWGTGMLLAVSQSGWAIDTEYRLSGKVGWIMPDGKVDKVVAQPDRWYGAVYSADFSATLYPDWSSLQAWNKAGVGVGLTYWNLAHPLLGHAVAPYAYLDIPLVRLPHFVLGLRPAIGAAFVTKTYANTVPTEQLYQELTDANICIGSVSNLYFPEALYMDFPIRCGWSVFAGGGWYHISNGSVRQPNSGYNIFAAELGVRYRPPHPTPSATSADAMPASAAAVPLRAWEVELSCVGGGRQVYYKDRQTFFVAALQAAAYWRACPIFRLGGGVDVFYDGAYIRREVASSWRKTNYAAADPNGKDCWRVGISLQPEFVVGRLTAGLHAGVYLYDPVRELEPYDEAVQSPTGRVQKPLFYRYDLWRAGSAGYPDGWLYTQVVLRYHFPYHLFVQGSIKTHLTKVEFIALGVGVYY